MTALRTDPVDLTPRTRAICTGTDTRSPDAGA